MQGLFQPLMWYASRDDQQARCCGFDATPCFPADDLPRFQIKTSEVIPTVFKILDQSGTTIAQQNLSQETITTSTGTDSYYSYAGATALPDGVYYYSVNGMYSDFFRIKRTACFCARISWSSCSYNGAVLYDGIIDEYCIYLEEYNFARPTFDRRVDGKENGFGKFTPSYTALEKYYNLFTIGGDTLNCALQSMAAHDSVSIELLKESKKIDIESISVSDSTEDCTYINTITYKEVGQCDITSLSCCESEFEDSPFVDPCTNDTDPGEPCPDDFGVTFEPDGNGNVVAVVTGAPSSFIGQIFINGAPQGSGTSISLGNFGTYTVLITSEGCTAQDNYIYQNPCEQFSVSLLISEQTIDGTITGSQNTNIEIIESTSGNVVATAFPATLPDGTYIVKVQSIDNAGNVICEFLREVVLSDDACNVTFDIVKSEAGLLTVENIQNCDSTPSVIWYKVDNASNEQIFTTGLSATPDTTAYYIAEINCGSCIVRKGYFCQTENKLLVEVCNLDDLVLPEQSCDCDIQNIVCIECTLYLHKDKCAGFSFTWTTPWGVFTNDGPIPVPESYHGQTVTIDVVANKEGCDSVPLSRTLIVGNNPSGQGTDGIIDIA